MKTSLRGLSSLYLAVFFLSLNGLFAKLIPLNAISITELRSAIAAVAFLIFCRLRKRALRLEGLKQFLGVYFLGVLLGVHWVTFFHSMQVSTVAIGMLSLFSFPVVTILLEPLFARERLKLRNAFAGVLVLLGIAVMLSHDLHNIQGSVVKGVFWGVLSALLFSLRNLIQKYHFNQVPSDRLMFHQVLAIVVMLVPFLDTQNAFTLTGVNWTTLVLLGVLSTATAHTLLTYSLKLLPAKSVALIGCLQPLIASILAWIVMNEIPQVNVAVGGMIILSVAMYESVQRNS
jgi:drug/metabolite transporter (DMT)-like permease